MSKKRGTSPAKEPPRWYRGADVPMRVIRRFARAVAERFDPDRIILFGSYAYGTPDADSDVDLLVVMPARDERAQATRIRLAVERCFPMDLIVRTPENLRWRLEVGDWFLREIVSKGKVLYEKSSPGSGCNRPGAGRGTRPPRHPPAPAAPQVVEAVFPPPVRTFALAIPVRRWFNATAEF
jgi:predicted nucleotidyltransferase